MSYFVLVPARQFSTENQWLPITRLQSIRREPYNADKERRDIIVHRIANESVFMNQAIASNRTVLTWSFVLSAGVIAFLTWLIYFKHPTVTGDASESILPAVNACLNAASACFLVAGFWMIRQGRVNLHRALMSCALALSAAFLVTYIVHHYAHGDTKFTGVGLARPVYFFVLISHVLLTVVALPLILTTVFLALTGRFRSHKRIARWTLPLWLYISVTGVLIFALLKVFS